MPLTLTEPTPLTDIIEQLDARTPVGSAMRSAEWARVPAGLRAGAVFSASVESARYLQVLKDGIGDITKRARSTNERGESYWTQDRSKLIRDLRVLGEQVGITVPGSQFPVPGSRRNEKDLRDPLSVARLKLVVNTQMEMAYGYGDWLTSQDPVILNEWPCWELVRISPRAVPRDWIARWEERGGVLHDGRMIALKTSSLWAAISRFGNPYPPFDFNSGMGVEEVGRDEAESFGLVEAGQELKPTVQDFRDGLKASITNLDSQARGFLKEQLGDQIQFVGNEARWNANGTPPKPKPQPKPAPKPAPLPPPPAPDPAPLPAPEPEPLPPPPPPRKLADLRAALAPLVDSHAALHAQLTDTVRQYEELRWTGGYGTERYNTLMQQAGQLRGEILPIIEQARAAIELPAALRGKVTITSGNTSGMKGLNDGIAIFERFVHRDLMPKIQVEVRNKRAKCRLDSTVVTRANETPSVIAHEITHAVEYQHAAVMKAAQEFLRSRRGPKEKPKKLSTLYPGHGYKTHEITIEDEWQKRGGSAYSGKVYHPGVGDATLRKIWAQNMAANPQQAFGTLYATEILTMGIERLHADPLAFAAADPEYFDFVISTLQKLTP